MATVNEKMTALADGVRELSGTTEPIGIDGMTEQISEANNEVESQADLIAQITSVLQGKVAGGELPETGGGSGNVGVETCTVKIIDNLGYGSVTCHACVCSDGAVFVQSFKPLPAGETIINNVICKSTLVCFETSMNGTLEATNATQIDSFGGYAHVYEINADSAEATIITINR